MIKGGVRGKRKGVGRQRGGIHKRRVARMLDTASGKEETKGNVCVCVYLGREGAL